MYNKTNTDVDADINISTSSNTDQTNSTIEQMPAVLFTTTSINTDNMRAHTNTNNNSKVTTRNTNHKIKTKNKIKSRPLLTQLLRLKLRRRLRQDDDN